MQHKRKINITLNKDEAFSTKKINIYDKESFTYDIFKSAQKILEKIVCETINQQNCNSNYNYNSVDINSTNNIIAFCAERGQGKTSAMLSFSKALKNIKNEKNKNSEVKEFWGDEICNVNFKVLDLIDPTTMENNDSIIKIIVSRLFICFEKELNKNEGLQKDKESIENLFGEFRTCYKNLNYLLENEKIDSLNDDIEILADLGDSSNLKNHFHKLIQSFLNILFNNNYKSNYNYNLNNNNNYNDNYNNNNYSNNYNNRNFNNNNFLVIQIDDADMNVEKAHEITEHLRKYCIIPNVLIVMSVNTYQLEETIEQTFLKSFNTLSKHYNDRTKKDCHDMAVKYIEKIFPGKHKIYLPNVEYLISNPLYEVRIVHNYNDNNNDNSNNEFEFCEYNELLIKTIRTKTGILLIKPEFELHEFFPTSLRGLSHFINFLFSLETLCSEEQVPIIEIVMEKQIQNKIEKLTLLRNNLEIFFDFFVNEWCEINLSYNQKEVIKKIHSSKFNYKTITILAEIKEYFKDKCNQEVNDNITKICSKENEFATIRYVLSYIEQHVSNKNYNSFIYAINFYINIISNIMLSDYILEYCYVTYNMEKIVKEEKKVNEEKNDKSKKIDINELLGEKLEESKQIFEHKVIIKKHHPFTSLISLRQFPWEFLKYNKHLNVSLGDLTFSKQKLIKYLDILDSNTEIPKEKKVYNTIEEYVASVCNDLCCFKVKNKDYTKYFPLQSVKLGEFKKYINDVKYDTLYFDSMNATANLNANLNFVNKNIDDKNIDDKNIDDKNIDDKNIGDKNVGDKDMYRSESIWLILLNINYDLQKEVLEKVEEYQENTCFNYEWVSIHERTTELFSILNKTIYQTMHSKEEIIFNREGVKEGANILALCNDEMAKFLSIAFCEKLKSLSIIDLSIKNNQTEIVSDLELFNPTRKSNFEKKYTYFSLLKELPHLNEVINKFEEISVELFSKTHDTLFSKIEDIEELKRQISAKLIEFVVIVDTALANLKGDAKNDTKVNSNNDAKDRDIEKDKSNNDSHGINIVAKINIEPFNVSNEKLIKDVNIEANITTESTQDGDKDESRN